MDIEAAIPIFCAEDSILNGLISGRIYYDELPPAGFILPALVFSLISENEDPDIDSHSDRFQFTAWAATPIVAKQIIRAVVLRWKRHKGRLSGIAVTGSSIENPGYTLDPETDEYGTRRGRACDIVIHYRMDI